MKKGQIESSFSATNIVKPISAGKQGSQSNPGVCAALNTPSTEGKIKTTWYFTPQDAPALAASPIDALDSSFRGQLEMTPGKPAGPDNRGSQPSAPINSSFEAAGGNPLGITLGSGRPVGSRTDFSAPGSNLNDGVGYGKNTSGGGDMNPSA